MVTADIPLAAEAIEKGALALNPRDELYTATADNGGDRRAGVSGILWLLLLSRTKAAGMDGI